MTGNAVSDFFLALTLAITAAKLLGAALRRIGQPAVVGEILAGILVSPMVLSATVSEKIFPESVQPVFSGLANVGLATFMFLVGYEMDGALLRGRKRIPLSIAVGSVVLPLAGGVALAIPLASTYAPESHTGFVLFVGVAMSVTAFPVLARILSDRELNRTATGAIVLVAAAIGDIVAWICLAGVIAFTGATGEWRFVLLPLYVLAMAFLVRPALKKTVQYAEHNDKQATVLFPVLIAGVLLSSAATEWLGIHFIFGAFAFGAIMPRAMSESLRVLVVNQMQQTGYLLLPLYFVVAGMKVDLAGFGGGVLLTLVLVITVAIVTKALGVYAAGRLAGADHGQALTASVLMNTRGLTEIVIVSVGLEMALIDQKFYSIMVVMAVVTTVLTGPLLKRIGAHRLVGANPPEGASAAAREKQNAPG
ncbi:cation:proton antiporter [Streptomyces sp. NPDC059255]|uniref:cation:proton antiporter domain-containing protein n=1 Tax=Streptomyces sp. NPDC059255 TaxID=3346793 RepID=UPI003673A52C